MYSATHRLSIVAALALVVSACAPAPGPARDEAPTQVQVQAQAPGRAVSMGDHEDPRTVAVTDEYGNRYNGLGERVGPGSRDR